MRILFVYERRIIPSFGGIERVTHLLASELRKRRHKVYFLSVGPREWNADSSLESEWQTYKPSSSSDFKEWFARYLKSKGIDKVIFQGPHASVVKALEDAPSEIFKVAVCHLRPFNIYPNERFVKGLTPWRSLKLKGKVLKMFAMVWPEGFRRLNNRNTAKTYYRIIESSDRYVFLSGRFLPRVRRLMPAIDGEKLFAVNNPNTFVIDAYRDEEKENVVLFVGRLSNSHKNVTGFLDVWKKFHKEHPHWRAEIVGTGEDEEYIKSYARRHRIRNLSFEGPQQDVASYYKKSKILCLTSSYEGWGMVLTEAMAYSCVPVAFDSYESIHDIIEDGKTGILIKAFDTSAMAKGMKRLASNEELRKKIASMSRESVKRFKVEKIADEWETLLKSHSISEQQLHRI